MLTKALTAVSVGTCFPLSLGGALGRAKDQGWGSLGKSVTPIQLLFHHHCPLPHPDRPAHTLLTLLFPVHPAPSLPRACVLPSMGGSFPGVSLA